MTRPSSRTTPAARQPEPTSATRCTAFVGHARIAAGALRDVAVAVKRAADAGATEPLLVFDDATGRVIDVDTRGSEQDVVGRLRPAGDAGDGASESASETRSEAPRESAEGSASTDGPRRRGRPRLGVVAREVTLLPRHWEWLAAQPGGASVALRKLVDEARRSGAAKEQARRAREAAYRFMHAVAGDLPGYEEATRALFAGDHARFARAMEAWPHDVRDHALSLAFPVDEGEEGK